MRKRIAFYMERRRIYGRNLGIRNDWNCQKRTGNAGPPGIPCPMADKVKLAKNWAAGDIMYKDLTGDGTIHKGTTVDNPGDLKIIGNNTPRFKFGLDLDALMERLLIYAYSCKEY